MKNKKNNYRYKSNCFLILLICLFPILSSCLSEPSLQTMPYKGMAFGKVTDDKGNAIEGVKVFSPGTNLQVFTNSKGQFTIVNLPLGKTLVVVQHSGYQSITKFVEVTGDAVIKDMDFVLKNYIYEIETKQIGTEDIQISWRTTVDANEKLLWGLSDAYGNKIISEKFSKIHSQIVYSIEVDAENHFKIFAKDLRGYEYETGDLAFTIEAEDLPTPVTITEGTATGTTVKLEWTETTEEDFAYYHIYRNTISPVLIGGHYVVGITDKTILAFTDGGLVEDTNYIYQVLVYDKNGIYAKSNEYQIKTLNPAPDAVTFDPPYEITNTSMKLSWSQSQASDFFSYQIFKSETEPIPASSEIIAEYKNTSTITHVVDSLKENQKFYFKVTVLDNSGQKTDSNTVGATTQNYPPPLIYLGHYADELRPDSAKLGWADPNITDFKKIDVYRSNDSPATDQSTLVTSITHYDVLSYKDTGLVPETGYFYRIYIYDQTYLATASNEITFTTPAVVPTTFAGGNITKDSYMLASASPYTISGDMTIDPDIRVIVEAGVEVKITANSDATNGGEDSGRVEIIVNGSFISEGNQMSRIKFISDSPAVTTDDWSGFTFKDETAASRSVFDFIDVENAATGCFIFNYNLNLNYCNFTKNKIGISSGGTTSTVIQNCYVSESFTNGISCSGEKVLIKDSEVKGNAEGILVFAETDTTIEHSNINLNITNGVWCAVGSNPYILSNNIMTNGAWAVNGAGVLGSNGDQNGNYISGNNGMTSEDTTVAGVQDGFLNTTTTQCQKVDAILSTSTTPIQ